MSEQTVAFIGVGKMGGALLAGLVSSGWSRSQVRVVEPDPERREQIVAEYGVQAADVSEAGACDVVVIGVKPQHVDAVLGELSPHLSPETLVVSIAAGVSTVVLERGLPASQPVVRVMPNTAALVGEGMAGVSGGTHATPEQVQLAAELLGAVGRAVVVPEQLQDAVTAVSGSGPAYVFYVAESLIDAAVAVGIPRPTAHELVVQTLVGSAKLLADSGSHPAQLRNDVTSPGGTTAAALGELERAGLRGAVLDAVEAAVRRSQELVSP